MTNFIGVDILKKLGFENLPAEEQEKFLEKFGQVLSQAVLIRAFELLSEEDKEELTEEISADPEALYNFLNSKIDNFDGVVAVEIEKLKGEIASVTA